MGMESDSKVILSEENGVIPQVECRAESWVVAEGWPSWSFVLRSLGCKDVHTVVKGLALAELLEVRATGLDPARIHSWTHLSRLWREKSALPRQVWVQGSRTFITEVLKLAKLFNITNYTCVVVESRSVTGRLPPVDGVDWAQLNHHRLGGLTLGKYRVLTSNPVDKAFLYKASEVRPRLKHILRSTESGIRVDADEVSALIGDKGHLCGESLVGTGISKVPVLSPSVFHGKTGLVQRHLTAQELMDVYDVDVGVQDKLLKYAKSRNQAPLNTFVRQVPGKILYRLALAVLQPDILRGPSKEP